MKTTAIPSTPDGDVNRRDLHPDKQYISRREFVGGLTSLGLVGSAIASTSTHNEQLRSTEKDRTSRTFRFAAAFAPRAEQLFPSDRWLEAIAKAGCTHVFLQVDPFFHPEASLGSSEEDGLWLLKIFSMTAGPVNGSYQAWLRAISDAATRHGLNVGMELWEPTLPTYAARVFPADWKGPALHDGSEPLCVLQPDARAWLLNGFRTLLQASPALNAIALGTIDNGANLCDSHCPRCGRYPIEERFSNLYRDIESTCKQVRPDFQLIPYDWFWPDGYFDATFSKLPRGTSILTRLEKDSTYTPDPSHPEWSGRVFDQSVGCDEWGPGFLKARNTVQPYGGNVLAMPTLSGMFEGWELPYVPAVGQMAKKFDRMRRENVAGWLDYDCGGIHRGLMLDLVDVVQHNPVASREEWLHTLAEKRYGAQAIEAALAMWQAFDAGIRVFPSVLDFDSIDGFSGRFGVAIGLVPLHPFLPERAREARDARYDHFWFDPHNFLTREALPPIRHCLSRAVGFARRGFATTQQLIPRSAPNLRSNAEFDAAIAELTLLAWNSASNFYEWAARVQGDQSVPVSDIISDEIKTTERYWNLLIRPELEVGNMTWCWPTEIGDSVPEATEGFHNYAKLTGWGGGSKPLAALGDFRNWKIAGLQQQLKASS